MYVRDILNHKGSQVFTVGPEESIGGLAALLAKGRIGAAVVCEDGEVVGVISERDIIHAVAEQGARSPEMLVREHMTSKVISCTPETTIDEVMNLMTERRIRHLPVLVEGRLAGIVSIGDVVKIRIESVEQEATRLREYIQA